MVDFSADQLAPYLKCQQLLHVSVSDLCRLARRRRIPDAAVLAACAAAEARNEIVANLNDVGLALSDIAQVMGLSRERARQLTAEIADFRTRRPERMYAPVNGGQLRAEAIAILVTNADLFNVRGNIKFSVLADILALTHPQCRRKDIKPAIADITLAEIALARLKIADPPTWLRQKYAAGLNSREILHEVNQVLGAHPMSEMTWSHFVRKLGFRPVGRPTL